MRAFSVRKMFVNVTLPKEIANILPHENYLLYGIIVIRCVGSSSFNGCSLYRELHLSAVWPNLSEETVADTQEHRYSLHTTLYVHFT